MASPDLVAHDVPVESPDAKAPVTAPTDTASLPGDPQEVRDPYEKANRAMFERNQRFNHSVVYPVAKAYINTVPEPVRDSIENFATNLGEPFVFANDLLQLRFKAAATTAGRFAINSTAGVGGVFDIASKENLPKQSGDFGQTLYVLGMRNSPYLVVPVIGPTNVRDLIGTTVEFAASIPAGNLLPTQIAATANNLTVAGTVASPFTKLGQADQMKELEESSVDFYSMMRSVVAQKRQAELQEALETSGWTAGHRGGATEAPEVATNYADSYWQVTVPKTKEQELVASAFQSLNE
jgi:phospholipid-binding lipoprotein MlaA